MGDETKKMAWHLRAGDDGGGDWKIPTGGKADTHGDRERPGAGTKVGYSSWER